MLGKKNVPLKLSIQLSKNRGCIYWKYLVFQKQKSQALHCGQTIVVLATTS